MARKLYGARGFVVHHNTDLWGDAVPIDGVHSGIWPMGAAWLSLHLWDHYDYTRDRAFLARRAYPVMKEAAEFFLDYLVEDGNGHLITGPSLSPENRYRAPDGAAVKLCMGPAMDTQIVHALFTRVIEAGRLLGVDAEFVRRVAARARERLPPMKIGRHGQLQEWLEDYEEPDPGHRHISHLFALHPDDQITLRGTPELARAARVSLERRLRAGSGHTGWSRAWIINFWARLEEGDAGARERRRAARQIDAAEPARQPPAVPDRRQLRRHRRDGRDALAEPRRRDQLPARAPARVARRLRHRPPRARRGRGRCELGRGQGDAREPCARASAASTDCVRRAGSESLP